MSATIDHLRMDVTVTVLQPFRDLAGALHPVGETGRILQIRLDWVTCYATFAMQAPDGGKYGFSIDLRAAEGPANGRMKSYFAIVEGTPLAPEPPRPPAVPPPPGSYRYGAEVHRVCVLAIEGRTAEAGAAFTELMAKPEVFIAFLPVIADDFEATAAPYATPESTAVFEWLYDKAIECHYRWAGQATSGGEGAAMMLDVKRAEKRRQELRRRCVQA